MIIYTVIVRKAGKPIFEHDISMQKDRSFSADVHGALERFRQGFPNVSLLDDDVDMSIAKKA